MRLPRALAIAALTTVAIGPVGCAFDRGQAVASRTLLNEKGVLDKPAYAAAMSAKFPNGSDIAPLKAYVAEFGGDCRPRDQALWCEIAYRGGFCYAAMVGLNVVERDGKIYSMSVEVGGLGC